MPKPEPVSMSCPRCGRPLVWLAPYGHWYCPHDELSFPATLPLPAPPRPAPPPPPPPEAPPPAWPAPARPYVQPARSPARDAFVIGAVGSFFSFASSIAFAFFLFPGILYATFFVVVPFFVGMVLEVLGFYGLWRAYGSSIGAATFAYGLAALATFLVAIFVYSVFAYRYFTTWPGLSYAVFYVAGWVALGVLFILQGVAFLVDRAALGMSGLGVAAGVLFIVGGSFVATVIFAPFGGLFILIPAFVLGGLIMLQAASRTITETPPPR